MSNFLLLFKDITLHQVKKFQKKQKKIGEKHSTLVSVNDEGRDESSEVKR